MINIETEFSYKNISSFGKINVPAGDPALDRFQNQKQDSKHSEQSLQRHHNMILKMY